MEGQLSLFNMWPPVIEALQEELNTLFGRQNIKFEGESYEVWEHVPYLGKRFCVWYDVKKKDWDQDKADRLVKKYEKENLELSYCITPVIGEGGDLTDKMNVMCSTMWKTKGHKEKW